MTVKMETASSDEMSLSPCKTKRCHNIEDKSLHSHCNENLKTCNTSFSFALNLLQNLLLKPFISLMLV
jgi:hypothetical protein